VLIVHILLAVNWFVCLVRDLFNLGALQFANDREAKRFQSDGVGQ
jgi:hypothetical protein